MSDYYLNKLEESNAAVEKLLKALKIADSIIHNFVHAAERNIVPEMSIGDFKTIGEIRATIGEVEEV